MLLLLQRDDALAILGEEQLSDGVLGPFVMEVMVGAVLADGVGGEGVIDLGGVKVYSVEFGEHLRGEGLLSE